MFGINYPGKTSLYFSNYSSPWRHLSPFFIAFQPRIYILQCFYTFVWTGIALLIELLHLTAGYMIHIFPKFVFVTFLTYLSSIVMSKITMEDSHAFKT
jgi:hypothetical protein